MIKHRKLIVAVVVTAVLAVPVRRADAIIPLIAGWLLAIGGDSVLICDIVAGMSGLIAGAAWYDCNKFSTSPVCTNRPPSMQQSAAPLPSLTVSLAPDAKRSNPDPSKFNDPAQESRDVTPKNSINVNWPTIPQVPVSGSGPVPIDAGLAALPSGDDGTNWMLQQSHSRGDQVMMAVLMLSSPSWSAPKYMPVVFQSTVCSIAATDPQRTQDFISCNAIVMPRYQALTSQYYDQSKNRMQCMQNDPTVYCTVMVMQFPMVDVQQPVIPPELGAPKNRIMRPWLAAVLA